MDDNKKEPQAFANMDAAVQTFKETEAAQPAHKQKGKKSKFAFTKKKKPTVPESDALAQIELLFDRYRIDIEEMQEEDLEYAESIETSANVVLKAIMFGEVEIYIDHNDGNKIKVKQYIQHRSEKSTVESITYSEITGHDNASMPDGKKVNSYDKMYTLLGSMSDSPAGESIVRQMMSSDLKTAQALSTLFLVP